MEEEIKLRISDVVNVEALNLKPVDRTVGNSAALGCKFFEFADRPGVFLTDYDFDFEFRAHEIWMVFCQSTRWNWKLAVSPDDVFHRPRLLLTAIDSNLERFKS